MKKSLLFLASAALVLASCNNDVKLDENTAPAGSNVQKEIGFAPYAQGPKRAISNTNYGAITTTTFNTSWGMTVSAYDVTNTREYFVPTNFVYNATPALWNGETHRYWPLSAAQINFLAIAHANADNTTGVTWTATHTTEPLATTHQVAVVMSDNYAIASAQRDFLYALGAGEVVKTGNVLTFPDKVDMTFKHTQAYLVFNLKAADDASTAITITNVKVKGARTSGTATIARTNAGAYDDADVTLLWASAGYHTDASTYESVTSTQAAISTDLTTSFVEMGHLLVVPVMNAAFTGSNESVYQDGFTSFEISYTLDGKAYTYEYTPATTVLMAGKKYIYNITFKLHEIMIEPEVEEWTTIDNNYIVVTPDVSMAYNALSDVMVSNAAGKYLIEITGLTAGANVNLTKTSDDDNIISAFTAQGPKVGVEGNVIIEVTKNASENDQTATIQLSVGGNNYNIVIKTPVTPAP